MDGEEIIKSKDCDFVDSNTTVRLLQLFQEKVAKRWIFNDFAFMDEREVNYVRKMYEVAQERHHGQKMGEYQAGEETGRVEGRKEGGMAAVGTMGTMGTMGTVGMTAIDGNSMGLNMSMQMMYSLNNLSLNGYPPNPLNPMCQLPNTITRPFGDPQTLPSLGFQKNPISKNKKK